MTSAQPARRAAIRAVADASPSTRAAFDEMIDVRSPAEYAEDHVPGAVNLPVLTDAQRAGVGTVYVQRSKFEARRLGAAHVSRNIADHLAGALRDRPSGWRPLIYCWRGGQRSGAMATVLSQVGWRVGVLDGGYRTYRREVVQALYAAERPLRIVLLRGPTGSGKTALLGLLARRGAQTLDLEGMAGHLGSLFGDVAGARQPSQKLFESRLAAALDGFDLDRPILVEAESSRIGEVNLPPRLWRAMIDAPGVELRVPLDARVRRIASTYAQLLGAPNAVVARLDKLPRHHSRERREAWAALARSGDAPALARALLEAHYDPSYRRTAEGQGGRRLGGVAVEDASLEALEAAAEAVLTLLETSEAAGLSGGPSWLSGP